jgi:anti-sigma regulatory factor (Ser/Thr protein kinase)
MQKEERMSLIGVVSSDRYINDVIKNQFENHRNRQHILTFLSDETSIIEFLNFDLPEIVIINFSDDVINLYSLLQRVEGDAWLHNFGIVGIYNPDKHDEEELLREYKDLNVLAMLDHHRVGSHIVKSIQIINQNRQIIFQRDLTEKLVDKLTGSFTIENDILAVTVYASMAATMLSQRGFVNPDAKMHLQLCLSELIVNGVEHGNCGITFDEKTAALDAGKSVVELVNEKCQDPAVANKRVYLEWEIQDEQTTFAIKDEGEGFNVLGLKEKVEKEGPYSLHGRGIKMARLFAHKLYYNKKGNKVFIVVNHEHAPTRKTPEGFSSEEVLQVKPGDIIFKEMESSNFLYYISSGRFSVYNSNRLIGRLGPEDIFMGEMSFLLNNRRSATVIAETEARLVKISRRAFVSVVKEYPHYGIFLSKLIARKLVRANVRNAREPTVAVGL